MPQHSNFVVQCRLLKECSGPLLPPPTNQNCSLWKQAFHLEIGKYLTPMTTFVVEAYHHDHERKVLVSWWQQRWLRLPSLLQNNTADLTWWSWCSQEQQEKEARLGKFRNLQVKNNARRWVLLVAKRQQASLYGSMLCWTWRGCCCLASWIFSWVTTVVLLWVLASLHDSTIATSRKSHIVTHLESLLQEWLRSCTKQVDDSNINGKNSFQSC